MLGNMRSFSILSVTAVLVMLLGLAELGTAYGTGELKHLCKYDVYCAVVAGCPAGTPVGQCPGAVFSKLAYNQNIAVAFTKYGSGTGVTIMCTPNPKASPILVTQLEWTWEKGQEKTYYDASNVAGNPFLADGFQVKASDPKDPGHTQNKCTDLSCAPGDIACNDVYEVFNDDEQAEKSCFDDVTLAMTLCSDNA